MLVALLVAALRALWQRAACGINFIEVFALIRIEIWLIVAFRAVRPR